MPAATPKSAWFDAFRAHIHARLDDLARTQSDARAGTRVDGDHRPANRGERGAVTSQGYLALGLGQRAQALRDTLDLLDRIPPTPRDRVTTGALVTVVDEDDIEATILVLPGGEGAELAVGARRVRVVSPDAPAVTPLLGLGPGDARTVRRGTRTVEVEVVEVR
jgi:hypothetical protein